MVKIKMRSVKIGLAGLLFLGIIQSSLGNYAEIKGKEYYRLCRKCDENEIEYFFYSPSIYNKKISWDRHREAERSGLSLICSACHTIHN